MVSEKPVVVDSVCGELLDAQMATIRNKHTGKVCAIAVHGDDAGVALGVILGLAGAHYERVPGEPQGRDVTVVVPLRSPCDGCSADA